MYGDVGKFLMLIGVCIFVMGLLILVVSRVHWAGKLPGDFHFRRGNFSFSFPLATSLILSIVLSIILTVVLNVVIRLFTRR